MIIIDKNICTGCGSCVSECVHKAITINNGKAEINRQLCKECGNCISVCPNSAIRKLAPVLTGQRGGGMKMVYGSGWGRSSRRSAGFGFRGYSPSWPYFGRGRAGLPWYWYPGLPGTVIPYGVPTPYRTAPTREEELVLLKNQTDTTKRQLEDIERRIQELEKKE